MAEDHAGDPAAVFDDLRAEVSVLRKAVEALPAALRANRPPDYAPDLAILGKGLDDIAGQLEIIQKYPALRLSPEQHGAAIANSGSAMLREAAQELQQAAQRADRECSHLAALIGTAKTQDRQFRELVWALGIAFAIGLVASPFLSGLLPLGLNGRIAALVMMQDRWDAGQALMQAGNLDGWAQLTADAALASANRDKISACQNAATKAKKEERCTITVQPAPGG